MIISRVLSFSLVAAWAATATPAFARDPSDPSGPPADDPAAWATTGRAPARVGKDLKRCDMMFADVPSGIIADDPTSYRIDRGVTCSCHACTLPMDHPGQSGQHTHHAAAHGDGVRAPG